MRPGKKTERSERVKSVERQYLVAEQARRALESSLRDQPALLTAEGLRAVDLAAFRSNLLDTYFIRLFAEFETAIKDYWRNGLDENPRVRIMDVIDALASRRKVADATRTNVHAARRWRNKLVHDDDADGTPVELSACRRYFGRFLGFLPDDW